MALLFNMTTLVVFLFILTYVLIIAFYHRKTYFVWASVIIYLVLGVLSPFDAINAVNWNVIGIFVGMLFISEMFIYSRIPDVLAEKIVSKSRFVWIAMLGVCFISGFLSIVIENVAVVLIVAPIALFISKKLKVSPVPLLIGVAVSSNLQGVATMIGDPPSLLLAAYAKMSFIDFFFFNGKPALFFAIQIAAIASLFVLYFIFRMHKERIRHFPNEKVKAAFPGYMMAFMIIALAVTSFITYSGTNPLLSFLEANKTGIVCMISGIIVWLWYYNEKKKDFLPLLKRLDWDTALFLVGIFVIVKALVRVGFMDSLARFIGSLTGNNIFLAFNLIVWSSVLLSAFVDNVPFVAAMLPVVGGLASYLNTSPYLLFFGLVIGASVGGNITPIGASANIVAMGILKKKGYSPSFWEFVKIGLPFTLVSVIVSSIFIFLLFK